MFNDLLRRFLVNRVPPVPSEDFYLDEVKKTFQHFGREVASRYSRGNISLQAFRFYLDADIDLREIVFEDDKQPGFEPNTSRAAVVTPGAGSAPRRMGDH